MKTTQQRRNERKKERFARQFHSKQRVAWVQSLPCHVTEKRGNVVNAHVKSRGSGGTYKDIVPLDWAVHTDFDTMPEDKFEQKYRYTKELVRKAAWFYNKAWEIHVMPQER